ncbi:MAG: hypothetical protein IJ590_02660 [Rickettsiales bacterium]|nr:hypothetical protein [Rickettsiales bacterium]
MTKCPFCGQEINNPEIYYENRKKIIENGRSALKRIDKIKEQNQMLIENERNKESRIYVRKKLDTKQRGKEKETVYSMIQKMKKIGKEKNLQCNLPDYHIFTNIYGKHNIQQVNLNGSHFTFHPNKS